MKNAFLALLLVTAFPLAARAKTGDLFLAGSANLWLAPRTQASAVGAAVNGTDHFSGGVSVIADYAIIDYLSLGGLFDLNSYRHGGTARGVDTQVSLQATARAGYPLGDRGQFLPYLRFAVGYTLFTNPVATPSSTAIEHGWGVRVLPGFQYTLENGLSLFAEVGWDGCGYYATVIGQNARYMFHSAVINFGLGYTIGMTSAARSE